MVLFTRTYFSGVVGALRFVGLAIVASHAIAAPSDYGLNPSMEIVTESTQYYFGIVKFSSPDGTQPYGETVSLIKRLIDPANNQINETVLQPPRNHGTVTYPCTLS